MRACVHDLADRAYETLSTASRLTPGILLLLLLSSVVVERSLSENLQLAVQFSLSSSHRLPSIARSRPLASNYISPMSAATRMAAANIRTRL